MASEVGKESQGRLFREIESELPGAGAGWLRRLRREAAAVLDSNGFPTRRDEDWRYTDVSAIAGTEFRRAVPVVAISAPTRGVSVRSVREVLEREPARLEPWLGQLVDLKRPGFAALNTALFEDGAFVEIEPGAVIEEPIEISIAQPAEERSAVHARVVIVAGAGSSATLLERYHGEGEYLKTLVTEINLEPEARLEHVRLQREDERAFHVGILSARQERSSRLASHSIALGGRIARVDLDTRLDAEGAECSLAGLWLAHDRQVIDHHTGIDHATPYTQSRQLYKGILDGGARGVFRGHVHVRPQAQKIDADQSNRNLLLSDDAICNAKPQLEIYANDVKCSHGCSIGQLSAEALFYLRSRGISLGDARSILTFGFASEIVSALPIPALRSELESFAHHWLPRFGEGEDA